MHLVVIYETLGSCFVASKAQGRCEMVSDGAGGFSLVMQLVYTHNLC